MADHRALLQYLGKRLLGEDFDVDEWQAPAELVDQISKPSAEIASVRGDFASALEAIAHRVANLENTPTVLPAATYDAIRRAVDARLASLPVPDAVTAPLDAAALADLATRMERVERSTSAQEPAQMAADLSELRELVMALVQYNEEKDDLVKTMGKALRTQSDRMQYVLAKGQATEAEIGAMRSIIEDVGTALAGITGKLEQAQRRA